MSSKSLSMSSEEGSVRMCESVGESLRPVPDDEADIGIWTEGPGETGMGMGMDTRAVVPSETSERCTVCWG